MSVKNYVISTRVTALLTSLSFIATLFIHYGFYGKEADFWCNICLAIFGSGLLALITSWIGYTTEKRHTLESFSYNTHSLIHVINKYELDWSLEKKIDFFLDYTNIDKTS